MKERGAPVPPSCMCRNRPVLLLVHPLLLPTVDTLREYCSSTPIVPAAWKSFMHGDTEKAEVTAIAAEERANVVRAAACILLSSFSSFTLSTLRVLRIITLRNGEQVFYYAGSSACSGTGHWIVYALLGMVFTPRLFRHACPMHHHIPLDVDTHKVGTSPIDTGGRCPPCPPTLCHRAIL